MFARLPPHPLRPPFGPPTASLRPSTEERPKGLRRGAVGAPYKCRNSKGCDKMRIRNMLLCSYLYSCLKINFAMSAKSSNFAPSKVRGEMPEWSIGAVSKTVDQLAGPRVRIPVSPQKKRSRDGSFFGFYSMYRSSDQRRVLLLDGVGVDVEEQGLLGVGDAVEALLEMLAEGWRVVVGEV